MPFLGEEFLFHQPDGTKFRVKGWGNTTFAVFETIAGFTILENPESNYWEYAKRGDTKGVLVPSGIRVGAQGENLSGLEKHLRFSKTKARESSRNRRNRMREATEQGAWITKSLKGVEGRWIQRLREKKQELINSPKTGGFVERLELSVSNKLAKQTGVAAGPVLAPNDIQPTVGSFVGLCLLIDFEDVPSTIPRQEVDDFCNKRGHTRFGNNGSVRDYFAAQSNGKVDLTNKVVQWYRAKHPRSYYTDEAVAMPLRAHEMIREALVQLVADGFNFGSLTRDSKGYVKALNVFYAGTRDNNWSKGLWPHSYNLGQPVRLGGGIYAFDYQITDMTRELKLGTFVHEISHMLMDFPDLYDYGYESNGVGAFCLMGAGGHADPKNPTGVCAYLKYKAGWASKVTTAAPGNVYTLHATNNEFLVVRNPKNFYEYLIVENRQKADRDAALPDQGIAVWHVDEVKGDQNNQEMTAELHYECALWQADGKNDLEKDRNQGDATDLFKVDRTKNYTILRGRNWWDGTATGFEATVLSEPGKEMRVEVGKSQGGEGGGVIVIGGGGNTGGEEGTACANCGKSCCVQ